MEHANAIAQHIRSLGEIPILRINLSLGGDPMRLEAALAEALDVEQQALDAYKDLLPVQSHLAGSQTPGPGEKRSRACAHESVRRRKSTAPLHKRKSQGAI